MEREGSGFDLIYEVLLSQGRPLPVVREGSDRVAVTVQRRIIKPPIIDFLAKADQIYQLRQREKIALGLLAQYEALTAQELTEELELTETTDLTSWIRRLQDWKIIRQTGRTRGTRYYVDPDLLSRLEFPSQTTLVRIEPYRLRELILEDLRRHPESSFGDIHKRIGTEISDYQARRQIKALVKDDKVTFQGERRWRRYWVT